MKKLLKVMLAFALVLSMSVNVFATDSKTSSVDPTDAVDANGNAVQPTVSEQVEKKLTEEDVKEVEEVVDGDVESIYTVNVSVPEGTAFPVTITFDVPAKEGQEVIILHWNGTTWEEVGRGTGSTIDATFDSLSPVGFVFLTTTISDEPGGSTDMPSEEEPSEEEPSDDFAAPDADGDTDSSSGSSSGSNTSNTSNRNHSGGSGSSTGDKSPKTGEQNIVLMGSMVALLAAGVAIVSSRKKAE